MRGRPSAEKRRKERARQDRKREKAQRREERKTRQVDRPEDGEEDPDIAGIVPGPQPPLEEMLEAVEGPPPDPGDDAASSREP